MNASAFYYTSAVDDKETNPPTRMKKDMPRKFHSGGTRDYVIFFKVSKKGGCGMKISRNHGMFLFLAAVLLMFLVACADGDGDNGNGGDNTVPVADAGVNQDAVACSIVSLDGSGSSDADGDALTFEWTLSSPSGSLSELSDIASEAPAFTPDVDGFYIASLVVNDGFVDSEANAVTITASEPEATTVSFTLDIQPVFDDRCIDCHAVDFLNEDASFLPLTSDVSYDNLVNQRDGFTTPQLGFTLDFLVKRCDSFTSVLFQRVNVNGSTMDLENELLMPVGTALLSSDQQDDIRIWIDEGALNN
jgi:hypothetical protein